MNLCVQDEMALLSMLFAAETSNRSHHGIDPWLVANRESPCLTNKIRSARAHSLGIQCVRSLTTEIGKEKGVTDVMIATVIHLAAVEVSIFCHFATDLLTLIALFRRPSKVQRTCERSTRHGSSPRRTCGREKWTNEVFERHGRLVRSYSSVLLCAHID